MERKGFTLVELLAVIIVLAITFLITTVVISNVIDHAKKEAAKVSALNYIEAVEKYIALSMIDESLPKLEANTEYQISRNYYEKDSKNEVLLAGEMDEIYINDLIDIKGEKPTSGIIVVGKNQLVKNAFFIVDQFELHCNNTKCDIIGETNSTIPDETPEEKINNSLLGYVGNKSFENDTYEEISINDEIYSAHIYSFKGDQIWDSNMIFGDDNDIGTSTEYAKNMIIVKIEGNLTIHEGVTVEPYYTSYGGPKGFLLYVSGTLINNGIINNNHGAYAEGQKIYLWENKDGSFEEVPAVGALGGDTFTTTDYARSAGNKGYDGSTISLRATGGGGNGSSSNPSRNGTIIIGMGGTGTSYSGGSGVGGCYHGYKNQEVLKGSSFGGAGTVGMGSFAPGSSGGGAGNPGAYGHIGSYSNPSTAASYKGSDGTGGLLIIYADQLENNGSITANGAKGGPGIAPGGGSGGGSINIFYQTLVNEGSVVALGGDAGDISSTGYGTSSNGNVSYGMEAGSGGAGTVTLGSISTGTFQLKS